MSAYDLIRPGVRGVPSIRPRPVRSAGQRLYPSAERRQAIGPSRPLATFPVKGRGEAAARACGRVLAASAIAALFGRLAPFFPAFPAVRQACSIRRAAICNRVLPRIAFASSCRRPKSSAPRHKSRIFSARAHVQTGRIRISRASLDRIRRTPTNGAFQGRSRRRTAPSCPPAMAPAIVAPIVSTARRIGSASK